MLHKASLVLVPSSDCGWITATFCITACQARACQRLQRVQNAAARIVCQAPRRQHHSAELLKDLHWLPVRSRVDYRIVVLCYKAVKLQQPSYLTGLLSSYRQSHVLRSSTSDLLSTQSLLTNTAARRFSCCAQTVWNSLLSFVRTADSFTSFRSQLKTHMFHSQDIL